MQQTQKQSQKNMHALKKKSDLYLRKIQISFFFFFFKCSDLHLMKTQTNFD